MIPYGRQTISESDIAAVVRVLQSDFLTQGPQVPAFEDSLKNYCGAQHAIAVNSATSALHLACLTLGLCKGDSLWTSPITFTASANCARYCGADVDFVDIDPNTLNMSPTALEAKLKAAKVSGSLPKIVVPVHFAGEPCDQGGKIGNCQYSDITVFSFHPVKIITTAEGGAALTNRPELAAKLALLRSHGITRNPEEMTQEPDGSWYYQQIDLGYNYRMTELQAALGVSQIQRIDEFVARRHELAARYDRLLARLPLILPQRNPQNRSALHLYPVQVRADSGKTRRQVFDFLRQNGIGANVHYIPVHTQPYYRQHFGFNTGDFLAAEAYYAGAISIPLYFGLTEAEQDKVVKVLERAFG